MSLGNRAVVSKVHVEDENFSQGKRHKTHNKWSKALGGNESVVMATVNKPQLFFPDPAGVCSYRVRFCSRFHPLKVY